MTSTSLLIVKSALMTTEPKSPIELTKHLCSNSGFRCDNIFSAETNSVISERVDIYQVTEIILKLWKMISLSDRSDYDGFCIFELKIKNYSLSNYVY